MKQALNELDSPRADAVLAAVLCMVGLLVRLPAALAAGFPLNDGGLFYRMILDLQANHFALPLYTTYNQSGIPFAYPPLALYAGALLASAFHADPLLLLRILPGIVSALCVPAFYFLARDLLGRRETALAASLAFALIPRGFEWHIMGGGITRSFGLLFALLTLRAAHALFTRRAARWILPATVWGSLTMVTHPEATLQAALACLLLFLAFDRSRKGVLYAAATAAGVLALSAPWWATVVSRFGVEPFQAASAAAREGALIGFGGRILLTFGFDFTEELYLPLIGMLGLIGLFAALIRRELFLPLWVTLPLFIEPRSAPQFMVIPLAMLAGIGLIEVLLPGLAQAASQRSGPAVGAITAFLIYLIVYSLFSAYLMGFRVAQFMTLQPAEREALGWVRTNAPPESRFAILSGGGPVADPLAEWFPALSDRTSLNTVFGLEWVRARSFRTEIEKYTALQACLNRGAACLQNWSRLYEAEFTHVLVRKQTDGPALIEFLSADHGYRLVYENIRVAIFERK